MTATQPQRMWHIKSNQPDFRHGRAFSHEEARRWLAARLEEASSLQGDDADARETLFQALAKVNALTAQQAANWNFLLPGRRFPVRISLMPWKPSRSPIRTSDAPGL